MADEQGHRAETGVGEVRTVRRGRIRYCAGIEKQTAQGGCILLLRRHIMTAARRGGICGRARIELRAAQAGRKQERLYYGKGDS